ncbi:hypothetical protein [Amycolatopsis eburnea]|uniref:Uncharacterized protein n=1 Tax=Amycolatopsis eburnea TaxID=2267691 RepID=A0A427T7C8_9PSEU|nr:hypothetical protein [Amycolatopsis eburnea]RSD16256.1 hypothetical protein EIY87_21560 [Amycolatopsis eburnea]
MSIRKLVSGITCTILLFATFQGTAFAGFPAPPKSTEFDHSTAFSTLMEVDDQPSPGLTGPTPPTPHVPGLPDCGRLPKQFTPQSPVCETSTAQGRFTGQIKYDGQNPFTLQWSFQLNGPTAALAAGPMVENADIFDHGSRITSYHDHHSGIPSNYLVHSSVSGLTTAGNYELLIEENFLTANGAQATVTGRFSFVITLV